MGRAVYDSCKLSTTPGEQARQVDCFFFSAALGFCQSSFAILTFVK